MDAFIDGTGQRHALSRVEIRQGRKLLGTGSASFMVVQAGDATPRHPMPRRSATNASAPSISPAELREHEVSIFRRAERALRGRNGPFIARLFGIQPRRTAAGASCSMPIGLHIGNRIGHAQGGILFGMAAETARAAAPAGWALVGASSWFTSPGRGEILRALSRVLRAGRSTAVVRTEIRDDLGHLVLEMVTSHAASSERL